MDTNKLKNKLMRMNIPKDIFSIENISDESLCIINESKQWIVFYSERDQKIEEEKYLTESEACDAFIKRITKMLGVQVSKEISYKC